MAAIDQDQQLHARRAAVIEQSVERSANGTAGIKHVIHQDDLFALHGEMYFGAVEDRLDVDGAQIVTIEIDVEKSDRDFSPFERFDFGGEPLRERNPAPADSDNASWSRSFVFSRISWASRTSVRSISDALMSCDLIRRQGHRTDCSARVSGAIPANEFEAGRGRRGSMQIPHGIFIHTSAYLIIPRIAQERRCLPQ